MSETPSTATVSEPTAVRREHDPIGDRDVPADVYWGVHTLRAVENFPISGTLLSSNTHTWSTDWPW